MYYLIIFWYGSFAAQLQYIPFDNLQACRTAINLMEANEVAGKVKPFCVPKFALPDSKKGMDHEGTVQR